MYDRELDGKLLTLGVSGKLYRNSLLMFDRETRTLWSRFLGAAVEGPLTGKRLRFLPSTFTTWEDWLERRPDTTVLESEAYARYAGDPYAGYYSSPQAGILGTRRRDDRLPRKALVLGVLQPAAKAYAFEDLSRLGRVRDRVAGAEIEVVWNRAASTASAFRLLDDRREPLPATPVFWFAWVDFVPGAPLWDPPDRPRNPPAGASTGWPAPPPEPPRPPLKQQ